MSDNTITQSNLSKRHISPDDIDLRGLLNTIWRGRKLFISIFLIGFLLTLIGSSFIKTTYVARSSLLIDNDGNAYQEQDIQTIKKATIRLELDFILTEIEVLKSRNLIAKVIRRLDLLNDSDFQESKKDMPDILETNKKSEEISPEKTFKEFAFDSTFDNSNIEIEAADVNEPKMIYAIDRFLDHLNVTSIPGTYAVKVGFQSNDGKKAALITNSFVDEYIKQRLNSKNRAQNKLRQWLDKRVEELRVQVISAETKAEEYRIENGLFSGKNALLSEEKISTLSNQLTLAQSRYREAQAKLNQLKSQRDKYIDDRASSSSVTTNLIKTLSLEKIKLENDIIQLGNRYGHKHPTMIKKSTELADIERKIQTQIDNSKSSLNDELRIARVQKNNIERSLDDYIEQNNADSTALIQYRELERDAQSSRTILSNFLEDYKKIVGDNILQNPGARVISYANIPESPSSPNKNLVIALGVFFSLILGLTFTFLSEKIYNKFRTTEGLENNFGVPCLGSIPFTRTLWGKNFIQHVLSHPTLPIIESIRHLRLGLKQKTSSNGEALKVISFLSSVKNEGKTTAALLMGMLSAKSGERVILIDTNLRAPSVHKMMDEENNKTLVDYLVGQNELGDVIHKDSQTGLHVIFGQSIPNNSFNLLSLEKLDILIQALRDNYDLILLDTPACLSASDARLIEQLSDISLYSVKYNSTKDKTVIQGIKAFLSQQSSDLALILTHKK